jgi:hypothetical protein
MFTPTMASIAGPRSSASPARSFFSSCGRDRLVASMDQKLNDILVSVWRQALLEDAPEVEVESRRSAVRRTSRHRLRQVDFLFDGQELRGLEQNPETRSRWAQMARAGKKVMQFLSGGRYLAVVVDGKVTPYGDR